MNKQYFTVKGKGELHRAVAFSKEYDEVLLSSANIPKNFYVLPQNAVLLFGEDEIEFSEGNYNVVSFKLYIQTKLLEINATTVVAFPNQNIEVDDGKYTFTFSDGGDKTFYTENEYLANMIGIEASTLYEFTNYFKSPNIVNFQSYDMIYIKSNIVDKAENLLQEVVSSATIYNKSIEYNNGSFLNAKALSLHGADYYFKLVDKYDKDIDLNGSEWSITLCVIDTGLRRGLKESEQ